MTADRGSGGSGRAVRGINDVTQRRICSPLSFIRKEKEGAVQRGTKERGTRCLLDFRGMNECRIAHACRAVEPIPYMAGLVDLVGAPELVAPDKSHRRRALRHKPETQ